MRKDNKRKATTNQASMDSVIIGLNGNFEVKFILFEHPPTYTHTNAKLVLLIERTHTEKKKHV